MRASAAASLSAAAAGQLLRPGAAGAQTTVPVGGTVLPPYVGAGSTAAVRPFALHKVTLGAGLLKEKQERMLAFARAYDERRFLVLFNQVAGRPNPPGVSVPGGWEDGGLLSGHWTGHFLTMLAQAASGTGEAIFADKLSWMVTELGACQDALTGVTVHPGYVGAKPEDVVLRVGPPRFALYGSNQATNTWAPWYTQHKIVRGFLDAYYLTANERALEIALKMADWAHLALTVGDIHHPDYKACPRARTSTTCGTPTSRASSAARTRCTRRSRRSRAKRSTWRPRAASTTASRSSRRASRTATSWSASPGRSLAAAARLACTPTSTSRTSRATCGSSSRPATSNTTWPRRTSGACSCRTGCSRTAARAGTTPARTTTSSSCRTGTTSPTRSREGGAETCTTYNVIKLARNLFFHDPDPKYMDYVERGLFNQIAGSRADSTSTSNPQVTYFQPLTPGNRRGYGNTGTCCGGTGMENHTKHQESIYSHADDDSALWVNQYISSTLTWPERGFTIVQETDFPRAQTTQADGARRGQLAIKLRVPAWATNGFFVEINGRLEQVNDTPGTYVQLRRRWVPGDTIEITMPFSIRIERARDRPDTQSVFWGPLLLPILGSPGAAGSYRELTLYKHLKRDGDYSRAAITPAGGQTLHGGGAVIAPALRGGHAAALAVLPARGAGDRVRYARDRRAQLQAQRRAAAV